MLTVAAIAASSCGCGLNKDAKTLADAYVLSLLSMNTDDLRLKLFLILRRRGVEDRVCKAYPSGRKSFH